MNSTAIQFDSLYSSMYSKILQYVSFRINDYDQAKDITGDIFLKIFERKDQFNAAKSAKETWVYNVAKNHLIDYFRVKKLDATHLSKMTNDDGDVFEFPSSMDTFAQLSSDETMNRVMAAINELPESHREIVYLNLIEDLKLEDVAERTNTPLGTVKVTVMKAKRFLANKLNDLA